MGAPKKPKGPFLGDPMTYLKAGINPATGNPTRAEESELKVGIRRVLRIIDQQDAIHRYKWLNLPFDLSSEELETLFYYYGSLCFFYFEAIDQFVVLPYTLAGTIDFYGRFNKITPVPLAATSGDNKDQKRYDKQKETLSSLKLRVIKEPIEEEKLKVEDLSNSAVLMWDYSRQRGQTIIPRQLVNEPILDVESDIFPFLRTAMISATGVRGMKVDDADASEEAERVSNQLYMSALKGKIYSPFTAKIDVQDLADDSAVKAEEFLLAMQSLENFRLGTYGIKNGGLFQKKAHELQTESDLNSGNAASAFEDGLALRQYGCMIFNSIWGTDMWVVPNETIIEPEINLDNNDNPDSSNDFEEETVNEEGGNSNE